MNNKLTKLFCAVVIGGLLTTTACSKKKKDKKDNTEKSEEKKNEVSIDDIKAEAAKSIAITATPGDKTATLTVKQGKKKIKVKDQEKEIEVLGFDALAEDTTGNFFSTGTTKGKHAAITKGANKIDLTDLTNSAKYEGKKLNVIFKYDGTEYTVEVAVPEVIPTT